jgi:serine protease AprX
MPNNVPSLRKRWGLAAVITAILLVFIIVLAPAPTQTAAASNVQPQLLALAAEQPDATVRVIVQKSDPGADLAADITQLGGTVINDLHIINALVAKLPASQATQLANSPAVRWISLDGVVESAGRPPKDSDQVDLAFESIFLETIGATQLWDMGLDGSGITVAVVDSGITDWADIKTDGEDGHDRILDWVQYSDSVAYHPDDYYGHGTHIAGTIGGDGYLSEGMYKGVAPGVNFVTVKVSDDYGMSYMSDVVAGLQWVLDHKDQYNIRIVNLALNSSEPESYHTSPLNAAVEILWFNGIVVVVSAGNNGGDGVILPPANDPFVISVGASIDNGTAGTGDDSLAPYSAYGITESGFTKPEIVAPGHDIVSLIGKPDAILMQEHPDHFIDDPQGTGMYFRMSGTSMASAVTTGAIALLLQAEPDLTPDQVKYRLIHTASTDLSITEGRGPSAVTYSMPYLNVYDAVQNTTTESANTGIEASQLLWTGDEPVQWGSVNWGSVNWGSVNWGSVNWGSVNWGSVNWGSVSWDE